MCSLSGTTSATFTRHFRKEREEGLMKLPMGMPIDHWPQDWSSDTSKLCKTLSCQSWEKFWTSFEGCFGSKQQAKSTLKWPQNFLKTLTLKHPNVKAKFNHVRGTCKHNWPCWIMDGLNLKLSIGFFFSQCNDWANQPTWYVRSTSQDPLVQTQNLKIRMVTTWWQWTSGIVTVSHWHWWPVWTSFVFWFGPPDHPKLIFLSTEGCLRASSDYLPYPWGSVYEQGEKNITYPMNMDQSSFENHGSV